MSTSAGTSTGADPVQQKLAYDFHGKLKHTRASSTVEDLGIFLKAQSLARLNKGTLRLEETVIISRQYRGAIRGCLQLLGASHNGLVTPFASSTPVVKPEVHTELVSAELLWSLFEAIIIRPGGTYARMDTVKTLT
ncbi:hypothetical protein AAVH_22670 [Aphelenchoides avenae]|nr:hypothetical protein AAVH_22670 [Aphelenchus avenae]